MANPLDQYSNPYQPEILGMDRQRKLAEMLIAQGQRQPQGQMVGNQFIPVAPTQNLANLFNTALGAYGMYQADQKALDLANRIRQGEIEAFADFEKIRRGTPAVEGGIYGPDNKLTMQTTPDMIGPQGELTSQYRKVAPVAGVAPNPQAAYANLYYNPKASPKMRDLAFAKITAEPEGFILPEGSTRVEKQPDGTYKVVASGGDKTSSEYKDYLMAQKDPIAPFKGSFVDYQTMNNRSKAPSVNVNTANKFASGFASKASEGAYNMYEQALAAPQAIENAKRTIQLVNSGAFTGAAADIKLQAARLFNVVGANNQDTISKTEQLFSNRGKAMLGSIKSSGLAGSQGLTEGERKFLTQAEGGTITLDAETLKAMAGLEIKMAVQNQKRWNAQASRMDREVLNATGAGPVEVYTGIGTIDESNPLLAPKPKK
jgi:hypothetical protein